VTEHLGDDHHLLERFRRNLDLQRRNAQSVAEADRAAFAAGEPIGTSVGRDPVDAVRLRGVPLIGPGCAGGAVRGTRPDQAILRLDG
jgi:hypothetical protein